MKCLACIMLTVVVLQISPMVYFRLIFRCFRLNEFILCCGYFPNDLICIVEAKFMATYESISAKDF